MKARTAVERRAGDRFRHDSRERSCRNPPITSRNRRSCSLTVARANSRPSRSARALTKPGRLRLRSHRTGVDLAEGKRGAFGSFARTTGAQAGIVHSGLPLAQAAGQVVDRNRQLVRSLRREVPLSR